MGSVGKETNVNFKIGGQRGNGVGRREEERVKMK